MTREEIRKNCINELNDAINKILDKYNCELVLDVEEKAGKLHPFLNVEPKEENNDET